jgi:hypothetical protein
MGKIPLSLTAVSLSQKGEIIEKFPDCRVVVSAGGETPGFWQGGVCRGGKGKLFSQPFVTGDTGLPDNPREQVGGNSAAVLVGNS